MGAYITKQPNGLFCRFSSVVDSVTHWNMTEQDYIDFCKERYGLGSEESARDTLKIILNRLSKSKMISFQRMILLKNSKKF